MRGLKNIAGLRRKLQGQWPPRFLQPWRERFWLAAFLGLVLSKRNVPLFERGLQDDNKDIQNAYDESEPYCKHCKQFCVSRCAPRFADVSHLGVLVDFGSVDYGRNAEGYAAAQG